MVKSKKCRKHEERKRRKKKVFFSVVIKIILSDRTHREKNIRKDISTYVGISAFLFIRKKYSLSSNSVYDLDQAGISISIYYQCVRCDELPKHKFSSSNFLISSRANPTEKITYNFFFSLSAGKKLHTSAKSFPSAARDSVTQKKKKFF